MDLKSTYVLDAQVKGTNQIVGLQRGLKGVSNQTNKAAGAMARLKTAAGGAMGALRGLIPLIGTAAMGKFVNDTLQAGDRLEKFAQKTGVAVPLLDKLRKTSELAGTDFNALVRLFPMLAKNMDQTMVKGTGPAAEAFAQLGIKVTDSSGKLKNSGDVLLEIADKFKGMEDGTNKAALAYKLFGARVGADLIPLLNSGSEAITGMGTTMTEEGVKKMAAFNDSMSKVKFLFQDMFVTLTSTLLPVLEKLVGIVSTGVNVFNSLPGPIKGITAGAIALAIPLITIAPIAAALVISFKTLAAIKLGAIFAAAIPAVVGLSGAFAPFLVGGLVIGGLYAVVKAIGSTINALKRLFKWQQKTKREKQQQAANNAEGGYVSGRQLSWVGERGGEYIVPTGKAGAFAQRYMAGFRGSSAIPGFAQGGFTGNANVSITTGPVTQMNGTNYVTTSDMTRAVQSGVNQTLALLQGDMKLRRQLGMA
jgi:hypothetical protein